MNTILADEAPMDRDEQAADWCMRLAEGRLSPEERRALDTWLAVPANRGAFEEAAVVWQGVETAADRPEAIHLRTRALETFRSANSRRWDSPVRRWRIPLATAAVILVAVFGLALYMMHSPQTYETDIGERRVVVLEDGSQLSLDAATRVKVRLAQDRRELRLVAGRARFDVAKDPLRPFSVVLDDKVVVATGTSFSVELLQRQMHVVLYEGRIAVLEKPDGTDKPRPLASRELAPGEELVASLDGPGVSILPADLSRALSWESGQLNFTDEPLASALERMNRYSRVRLVAGTAQVAALRINGVFTAGDTEAFIEGVTTFFPVEVVRRRGMAVLESATPGRKSSQPAVPPEE